MELVIKKNENYKKWIIKTGRWKRKNECEIRAGGDEEE
jgi:hypothetical protein